MTDPYCGARSSLPPTGGHSAARAWRRTIRLLLLLLSGDHSARDLIARIAADFDADGDQAYDTPGAEIHALRRDLTRLRELKLQVVYDFRHHRYHLAQAPPTLVLPAEEMAAIPVVRAAFGASTPHGTAVLSLLDRIIARLSRRQQTLARRAAPIAFQTDIFENLEPLSIDIAQLERAILGRQEIMLRYRAASRGEERRYRLVPRRLIDRSGHCYLLAYHTDRRKDVEFRLDRVSPSSVEILPSVVNPPIVRTSQTIRFRVTPELARFGLTPRFLEQSAQIQPDGSAIVTGRLGDPFQALRILLGYGDGVEVLDPVELRDEIAGIARRMALSYSELPDNV